MYSFYPNDLKGIGEGEVLVYLVTDLDLLEEEIAEADAVRLGGLSPEEIRRARTFRIPLARTEYLAGRIALRRLIASYLECTPAAVELTSNETGKPKLPAGRLGFNLAHSGGYLALAFTLDREIGIDVEPLNRTLADGGGLIREICNLKERLYLESLTDPGEELIRLFTRKEAVLKAMGTGLTTDPRTIDVLTDTPLPQWTLQSLLTPQASLSVSWKKLSPHDTPQLRLSRASRGMINGERKIENSPVLDF